MRHATILLVALTAAYANHFQNSFHFDDAHTIVNNAAIHDLRNIPRFFIDSTTFSSLPSNQSYRPLVSTLVALSYSLGHGLHPFWFHLPIFILFIVLVLMLVLVIEYLLEAISPSSFNRWIALGAAALYGLHPANADTVNYVIASSEVISTLGLVASFAVYFGLPGLRRSYLYTLPAALTVLAKPTAAIFPVLFAIYWLLFRPPAAGLRETPLRRLGEIVIPFVLCATALAFVQHMTPPTWIAGAANTPNYLITQPYVALLYFKTFFWPADLSVDYDLNPFTTTDNPRFWAGFVFVVVITTGAILLARSKRTRLIGFGLIWFVVALLPTSLFPLAEVMNDHRTFLPYIGLVIALAATVALLLPHLGGPARWKKVAVTCAAGLLLSGSACATFQRNKVWKSEETLWHDVAIKSPRNGRGLMNFGNTLMAKGDFAGALNYFHRAEQITPHYSVLLINLAIAEDATKQSTKAEQHFKEAMRLTPSSPDSYTYYARYLLSHSRIDEARAFLQSALELSPTDLTAPDLLAQADAQSVNKPAPQTPEYYLNLSLQFYGEARYAESIVASRRALDLRPGYAEAWNNICAANNKLGRYEDAAAACEQALRSKPDFELARNNLDYARQKLKPSKK